MFEILFLSTVEMYFVSLLVCLILRETMIFLLPNHIAGPGGSFIDTGNE